MSKKIIISVSLVLFLCIIIASLITDKNDVCDIKPPIDEALSVELIPFKDDVVLVNSVIENWLNGENTAVELYDLYRDEYGKLDLPTPLTLRFSVSGIAENESITSQLVEISENEAFENAKKISVEPHKKFTKVYNLKTGFKYFCRVTVETSKNNKASVVGSFTTADTPRILMIDGLRNVRDIGGYKTVDGKTIKQGLLYRGVELRGLVEPTFKITDNGIDVFVNELGIKTEFDLRTPKEGGETVHQSVSKKYFNCGTMYSEIFTPDGRNTVYELFSEFANAENFPAYIHCTYGSDRTGTIIYLLQALLGVSEEKCFEQWELTTFYNGGSYTDEMIKFTKDLQNFRGNTLQEKTETFLLSCGVKRSQINSIKNIFLTD